MDKNKRDQQQDNKSDQRQMGHDQNKDLGSERNEEETGKPLQLDKEQEHQDGHRGGKEHQGNQPHNPQSERKPDQGQRTGQR